MRKLFTHILTVLEATKIPLDGGLSTQNLLWEYTTLIATEE